MKSIIKITIFFEFIFLGICLKAFGGSFYCEVRGWDIYSLVPGAFIDLNFNGFLDSK